MAHLIISDLSFAETLDRKAVTSVKGGWTPELYQPRFSYPFFPSTRTQNQNIAVNAVQLASNQGFGSITQNMAIGVSANQA
ncbi:MAG: hypothetical protein PVF40_02235 [Ectothiorhodospiraceae bacterium]|jgi:hypothetical protein